MLEKLDLRFHGKLSPEISCIFNKVSYDLRKDFNGFVSELSKPYINNLDWWVQGPASRNTFSSSFFHNYCCLHLLQYLIENNKFSFNEILVDSLAIKKIFANYLSDSNIHDCNICCNLTIKENTKKFVKRYFLIYILFARKIIQLLIARITRKNSDNNIPSIPLVLIDTFVIPCYTNEDRWYGSLWDNLTAEQRAETFFVPTVVLTPLKSMYLVYSSLRFNARNFIIKEDYIRMNDLYFALSYKSRIKKIQIKPAYVLGYDFSSVIQDEFENNPDVPTVVESLLTYRFIQRLKSAGVTVRLAIDWFEGQAIDKAWNKGFRDIYPDAKTIGYRAFESFPFYLCSYPLPIEKKAGVIPAVMAVQGRGTLETVNEFMPDLDAIVIPSFKSGHVWEHNERPVINNNTVLTTLPISLRSSLRIIKLFCSICEKNNGIKVIIKPHPTHSIDKVKKSLNNTFPNNLEISPEKSLSVLLNKASLLVTEASSTCLEAMATSVPVIMMENQEGLTFDPIPDRIPKELYRKIRTEEQLIAAIDYYFNFNSEDLEQQKIRSKKVREDYFEPITKDGVNRFMNIGTNKRTSNA